MSTRAVEPNFADKTIWTGDNLHILSPHIINRAQTKGGMKGGRLSLEQGGISYEMGFRLNPPVASNISSLSLGSTPLTVWRSSLR